MGMYLRLVTYSRFYTFRLITPKIWMPRLHIVRVKYIQELLVKLRARFEGFDIYPTDVFQNYYTTFHYISLHVKFGAIEEYHKKH